MEILLYGAIGYGIGKLYVYNVKIIKQQHNTMLKHHIKMFKMNIKNAMIIYYSEKKDIIENKIYEESKILENQFINDYPELSLRDRNVLAIKIIDIKYLDEIKKIEQNYNNYVLDFTDISDKIDEFFDNEIQIGKVKIDCDLFNDRYKRFIERIYDILITGNIDNLNCKEQLEILHEK
tara:strand:+ start:123 stop:656 length:534 start_codon:yes stop_codon:yes gene_type:complete